MRCAGLSTLCTPLVVRPRAPIARRLSHAFHPAQLRVLTAPQRAVVDWRHSWRWVCVTRLMVACRRCDCVPAVGAASRSRNRPTSTAACTAAPSIRSASSGSGPRRTATGGAPCCRSPTSSRWRCGARRPGQPRGRDRAARRGTRGRAAGHVPAGRLTRRTRVLRTSPRRLPRTPRSPAAQRRPGGTASVQCAHHARGGRRRRRGRPAAGGAGRAEPRHPAPQRRPPDGGGGLRALPRDPVRRRAGHRGRLLLQLPAPRGPPPHRGRPGRHRGADGRAGGAAGSPTSAR